MNDDLYASDTDEWPPVQTSFYARTTGARPVQFHRHQRDEWPGEDDVHGSDARLRYSQFGSYTVPDGSDALEAQLQAVGLSLHHIYRAYFDQPAPFDLMEQQLRVDLVRRIGRGYDDDMEHVNYFEFRIAAPTDWVRYAMPAAPRNDLDDMVLFYRRPISVLRNMRHDYTFPWAPNDEVALFYQQRHVANVRMLDLIGIDGRAATGWLTARLLLSDHR